jgi:hypothetical protein
VDFLDDPRSDRTASAAQKGPSRRASRFVAFAAIVLITLWIVNATAEEPVVHLVGIAAAIALYWFYTSAHRHLTGRVLRVALLLQAILGVSFIWCVWFWILHDSPIVVKPESSYYIHDRERDCVVPVDIDTYDRWGGNKFYQPPPQDDPIRATVRKLAAARDPSYEPEQPRPAPTDEAGGYKISFVPPQRSFLDVPLLVSRAPATPEDDSIPSGRLGGTGGASLRHKVFAAVFVALVLGVPSLISYCLLAAVFIDVFYIPRAFVWLAGLFALSFGGFVAAWHLTPAGAPTYLTIAATVCFVWGYFLLDLLLEAAWNPTLDRAVSQFLQLVSAVLFVGQFTLFAWLFYYIHIGLPAETPEYKPTISWVIIHLLILGFALYCAVCEVAKLFNYSRRHRG